MTPALPTPSAAAPAARYAALLRVVRLLTAQRSPTALFRVLARELRQVVAWAAPLRSPRGPGTEPAATGPAWRQQPSPCATDYDDSYAAQDVELETVCP